jgi:type IV pilus assembly protein PilO
VAIFFDQVSRLSRIVNISDVNMTQIKSAKYESDVVVLKTGCTATTYKFIEPKEPPKKGKRRRK